MEGGDDGGMDIAAVQALGREEKREFSWKEGKEEQRTEKEQERATHAATTPGNRGVGASMSGSRPKAKVWYTPKKHSWDIPVGNTDGQLGCSPLWGHGDTWEPR